MVQLSFAPLARAAPSVAGAPSVPSPLLTPASRTFAASFKKYTICKFSFDVDLSICFYLHIPDFQNGDSGWQKSDMRE